MSLAKQRRLVLFFENASLFLDYASLKRASQAFLGLARDHFPTGAYRVGFETQYETALRAILREHITNRPGQAIDPGHLFAGAFRRLCDKREFRPQSKAFFDAQAHTKLALEKEAPRSFPLYHDASRLFKLLRRAKEQKAGSDEWQWARTVVVVGPTRKDKNLRELLQSSGLSIGSGVEAGGMLTDCNRGLQQPDIDLVFSGASSAYGGYRQVLAMAARRAAYILNDSPPGREGLDLLHIGQSEADAEEAGYSNLKLDRTLSSKTPDLGSSKAISDLRDIRLWWSGPVR